MRLNFSAVLKWLRDLRKVSLGKISKLVFTLLLSFRGTLQDSLVITCIRDDGGGAQLHGRISTFVFAKHMGIRYLNTPISGAHFSSSVDWDQQWNKLLVFPSFDGSAELTRIRASGPAQFSLALLSILTKKAFAHPPNREYLLEVDSMHWITNYQPHLFADYQSELIGFFHPPVARHQEEVVIHLRRGDDVTANIRFESDEVLLSTLDCLRAGFPGRGIRIYSNQSNPELAKRCGADVIFDCESNPFSAIAHMSKAEVVVIAKSSMSYVAGLLSRGKVISPDFWHPRVPGWVDQARMCLGHQR